MEEIILNGENLTITEVVRVARYGVQVKIDSVAMEKVSKCRKYVDDLVNNKKVVYGLTTGFASFKDVAINKNQTEELQKNLIESHAVGVGDPFAEEIVRGAMLIRINSLIKGYSGIRPIVVETLVEMLNKKIYAYVPEKGSVGSSGDLAPLSHLMLVLMGKGEAFHNKERVSGARVMEQAGITPISLKAKEGLALNNGTAFMTSVGAIAVYDAYNLVKTADVSLGMTMEAIEGIISPFDPRVHENRPHKGQIFCANNLRKLCNGSMAIKTYKESDRVQDSYSIRCSPQVHGASREALDYVRKVVETELNSATDNPLLFDGEAISCGNFHGEPIAIAMDCLGIAVAEIGSVSERRISKMVDPATSNGLPIFLIEKEKGGLNSGFMMPQYTAAALVSENKVLAHPASVDSIPTSANQEDHVSMGTIAARKARQIIENVRNVLSIELINSVQGIDLRKEGKANLSQAHKGVHDLIRKDVLYYDTDRPHYPDMNKVANLILEEQVVKNVEEVVGKLN